MGTKARREKEKEHMKGVILEAATKIITLEGYDGLSMRKIADAIDYTPTTIYSYYKDKAAIVNGISRQIYDKIIADVKTAFEESKGSPMDVRLKFLLKAFLYSIADNPEMGMAVIKSGTGAIFGPSDDDIPQENNGTLILQEFLKQGQSERAFRKLDSNMPWMLITALIGFALNAIENGLHRNENWAQLVEVYADMLVRGLLPGGDRA